MSGMKEAYALSEMPPEGTENSRAQQHDAPVGSRHNPRGCHVTPVAGFILLLLALLIAVFVGLIVHFATPGGQVQCTCNFPEGTAPPSNPEALWQACVRLTVDKGFCLVPGCQGRSPIPGTDGSVTTPFADMMSTTEESIPMENIQVRLPTSLHPVHYSVELEPRMYEGHVDNFTFRGSVDILMKCVEATNNITVHMKGLSLVNSSIALSAADGAAVPAVVDYDVDRMYDFLALNLNGQLEAGRQYHIYMDFTGTLSEEITNGLYLTKYRENGSDVYLALTQFEMTHARQAFPCFDEPALKATYDVTLVRRNDHSALSNMPVIRSEARGTDMTADIFNTSVRMSTYTVAFVISKYSGRHGVTARGVKVGVWSRPAVISTTDYALDLAADLLDYFEGFYNISYPLPKIDMLATPVFAAGAMENFGMPIYVEKSMLFDPDENSASYQQGVAYVISHEIAHQWFGNLVTCRWWEDIWLNEAFTTLDAYRGVDFVHPDWNIWEIFITKVMHKGFGLDETKSSSPMTFPVVHPDEIRVVLTDAPLVYVKGASVLRMIQHFIGQDTFIAGIKTYLETHAYGSVSYTDLTEALETARGGPDGGISIKDMLETWLLQMNYPVVTIRRSADHAFTVSQARFVLNPDEEESEKFSSPYGYQWHIPFTFTTNLEKDFNTTRTYVMIRDAGLERISDSSIIPEWNNNSWVIGNLRSIGFYRVNYDADNWEALILQLSKDHKVIPPENRARMVSDAWYLSWAGLTDVSVALGVFRFLENEGNYISWKAAEKGLDFVDQMLMRTDLYGFFGTFMRTLVTKQYGRLGFHSHGSHQDRLLQPLIVYYACRHDVMECVTEAQRLFAEWMTNETKNPVPQELKTAVYCTAVAHGSSKVWDFAYRMFRKFDKKDLSALHNALGCSKERWILLRFLNSGLHDRVIGPYPPVASMAATPIGSGLVWDFLQQHWDELGENVLRQSVAILLQSSFNTPFDLAKLQRWLTDHMVGVTREDVQTANANMVWKENNIASMSQFLQDFS